LSICTFLASDHPLPPHAPSREYPLEINLDTGRVYDGGADDNFFLRDFADVQSYSDRKYGVWLEWRYTPGRAEQLTKYIRDALLHTDRVELWRVWLPREHEYENSPVIHGRSIPAESLGPKELKELDSADIWNRPDKRYPNRPSFYRWTITK